MLKTIKTFLSAIVDLYHQFQPEKNRPDYGFAFMIHPRSLIDVYRIFPLFKFIPNWLSNFLIAHFWPVTISKITGLKTEKGEAISGWVISIPLTAQQMLAKRELALNYIIEACHLAQNKGAKIIGLGALTSSLCKGGLDLIDKVDIAVTTGHSYTAYNVTQTVLKIMADLDSWAQDSVLAIVGASGSIGSASAKILAKHNFREIILIDVERKKDKLQELADQIKEKNNDTNLSLSHQVGDVIRADFIITATNTPEALVRARDLKTGAIIIDDAQPSDVAMDVYDRNDVLVLAAGAVHTPKITTNFNLGLQNRYDNFCCLAEVLILASEKRDKHYTISQTNDILIEELATKGQQLGFVVANYQNIKEIVPEEKILHLKKLKAKNTWA
ncbi:MAG: polysaccharide biosynthesis protein [Candidatus Paceibacterota bacterium]|jgi:predicted amino acid dehydrogenase